MIHKLSSLFVINFHSITRLSISYCICLPADMNLYPFLWNHHPNVFNKKYVAVGVRVKETDKFSQIIKQISMFDVAF